MNRFIKKIVVYLIILSTILSLGLFNFTLVFADDSYSISSTSVGSTFSKQTYFQTTKGLSALPNTFETVISLPKDFGTDRAGVIFSNYNHSSNAAISVELYNGGYPRLYYKADGDTTVDIVFNKTCVLDYNGYFHLAITHDDTNKTAKCYINGVLKQTLTYAKTYQEAGVSLQTLPFGSEAGSLGEFRVGNDFRHDNAQFFKGNIKTIAVYSNVKTTFDANKIAISNDLIVAYDLSDLSNLGKDLSKNDNDAIFRGSPSFGLEEYYVVDKKLDVAPKTFEAWIKLPSVLPVGEHITESNTAARGGVIFGNYKSANEASISFEVTNKGEPKLFYIDSSTTAMTSTKAVTITFSGSSSNLLNDKWTHLAITLDTASNQAKCYINGVLTETKTQTFNDYHRNYGVNRFLIGNDYRAIHNFKGAIKDVTLYSDVRTDVEILSDKNALNLSNDGLIANISASNKGNLFIDKSNNGYNAYYTSVWLDDKAPVTDYAYAIAVVGDTQIANMYDVRNNATILKDLYKWIADNVESKKIVQVLGLGDITESSSDPTVADEMAKEWANAKNSISQLDGKVGYSLARGNHDDVNSMLSTFGSYDNYTKQFDGFYKDNILNSYKLFEVEGVKYMLITLDYGASDATLNWASNLCEAHPDRRVIITTHAYLFRDGTTLASGDVCEPVKGTDRDSWLNPNYEERDYNNGDDMWDDLIKKHENIFLVLSGHDPSIEVVCSQVKGEHGNIVTQILVDPQGLDAKAPLQGNDEGPLGLVTLLYFSADGTQIDVETYSTRYKKYHMSTNQFTIKTPCLEHVFDQQIVSEFFVKEAANCQHGTLYYYSCECGSCGDETFTVGNPTEHVFNQKVADDAYLVTAATCQSRAIYNYSCKCGLKGTEKFKIGTVSGHVFDQQVVSNDYLDTEATCTEPAHYFYSCACSLKGDDYFTHGNALNHNYVLSQTIAPSYENQTDGYELWVCDNDPDHTEKRNIIEWETLTPQPPVDNGKKGGCKSFAIGNQSIILFSLTFVPLMYIVIKRKKTKSK